MLHQLALPDLTTYPTCVFCGQPGILGQFSPLWPHMVCRECSVANPYPIEVFEISDSSKDRSGLRIIRDAPYELRERRAWLDDVLKQAAKGIIDERDVTKLNITYRDMRNPIRRSKEAQYIAWGAQAKRNLSHPRQLSLPYCERCGRVHDRHYQFGDQDSMRLCQGCDDVEHAETLWRMRKIFEGDDPETVMDRVYAAFPGLFERGIMPDYWFEMLRSHAEK
jgi:hypothetical protein